MGIDGREPYWRTTVEHDGTTLPVEFYDLRGLPTPKRYHRWPDDNVFEEVAVAVVSDREPLFMVRIWVHPKEDLARPMWPYPHRSESWALREIADRLESGDWKRGALYLPNEPDRPKPERSVGDFIEDLCSKIGITDLQLTELTSQRGLVTPEVAALKDSIARRFDLPSSEFIGLQLARKGRLTKAQGHYLDGLDPAIR